MVVAAVWLVFVMVFASVRTAESAAGGDEVPICWGSNEYNMSVLPSPAMAFIQLSAAATTTCGLTDGQRASCWGNNTYNQLNVPSGLYAAVCAGYKHSCAIEAGTYAAVCWGSNNQLQLDVPTGVVFDSIACGWWHSCGIQANGTVLCWGGGNDQDFGQAAVTASAASQAFKQIAPGYHHTCGLAIDGAIACWGGNTSLSMVPSGSFSAVGSGDSFSCGLRADGAVLCWGEDNTYGQLDAPVNSVFTDLWVSRSYACGLLVGGDAIECWGLSANITPPANYSGWSRVTAGETHMCGFAVPASTPSITAVPQASATPTATRTPSPTASSSITPPVSRTPLSSRSPSPSATSSPVITFAPISANVTATFGSDAPVVAVAAPVAATSGAPASNVQVRSELSQLQSGTTDLSNVTWAVTNSSDDTNSTSSTMINYSAVLADNTTSVKQTYAFHAQPFDSQFSGLDFTVSAGAVKWSINLTSTAASDFNSSAPGLQFAFRVSTNATTTTSAGGAASSSVSVFRNTPRSSMTTYWVPSGVANVVVEVQVFDVALVDGQLVAINHSVVLADAAGGSTAYDLMLWFPPFARSLEYDPSIGLGTLVGSNGRDGGGTSSDNTAVIVGVAVAVPVAVAVVLAVIVAALAFGFYRKRKATSSFRGSSAINFSDEEGEENL